MHGLLLFVYVFAVDLFRICCSCLFVVVCLIAVMFLLIAFVEVCNGVCSFCCFLLCIYIYIYININIHIHTHVHKHIHIHTYVR